MALSFKKYHVMFAIPVLLIGGTEIQVLSVVRVLVSAGYRITVCCYYEYDIAMVKEMEAAGAEVIIMGLPRSDGLWHLVKKLKDLFKKHQPDIVHVQYVAPGLVPIVAARLAGIRAIFSTIHIAGSIVFGSKGKFLLRLASKFCTVFFCVSKGVEEFWFGSSQIFDPEKIERSRKHYTIYNTVDTEKISKIVMETDRDKLMATFGISNKKVLGIVGRLAYQKGHAVLFDALPEVIGRFPDVVLLIIGAGPERESLDKKAKELGVDQHIIWFGEKKHEEVFRLYSIMNIFVMPSLYEGFGLVAAEAMAAGVPVVATKVDGLTEVVVDNMTGLLVLVQNSKALSEAIKRLLNNPAQAKLMGLHGKKRIERLFSMDTFSRKIIAAYEYFSGN